MIYILPWPPSILSPNYRAHWAKKAKAKKKFKSDCYYSVCGLKRPKIDASSVLVLTFFPPDKRRFDSDNILARLKSGLDGVCEAWRVNDYQFFEITIRRGPAVTGGKIEMEIRP